ncbi:MAG: TIGR03619 family F420-dependent LLM class oxidoreductase [Actinomycetota bacterium]|nr:TIGR03619 family F420-dependent LLM class oxidoreductase [Actinomycetota bacterium]
METGLVLPTIGPGASRRAIDAAVAAAVRLGWASVWVTDHLMVPHGPEAEEYGTILEAVVSLGYVAGGGTGLTIGTSVLIPPMRNPVILAKQLATLDVLTGGKVIAGVGVADRHDLPEFTNLGAADRFTRRGAFVDETIALWRHLWSGGNPPFTGEFHDLQDYVFGPLPAQGGDLPIWTGGRSAAAIRRAALLADGYHAAQTGPSDLRERLLALQELCDEAGRAMPTLSVRARVHFGSDHDHPYAISGDAGEMQNDVAEFAGLGVEHLVVVLGTTDPAELTGRAERFQSEVVEPALA